MSVVITSQSTDEASYGGYTTRNFYVNGAYYVIYEEALDIYYKKSTDSGSTWGSAVQINSTTNSVYNPSATIVGDVIHIVYNDTSGDALFWRTLDTSSDTLGTESQTADLGIIDTDNLNLISVTDNGDIHIYNGSDPDVQRSQNSGSSWSSITYGSMDAGAEATMINVGNTVHFFQNNGSALEWFSYDGTSWTTETNVTALSASNATMSAAKNSNDTIFITLADSGPDLEFYSKTTGQSTFQTGTNVLTSRFALSSESNDVAVNLVNDDIYVVYNAANGSFQEEMYYKVSSDGGSTWGSETALGVADGDDLQRAWLTESNSHRIGVMIHDATNTQLEFYDIRAFATTNNNSAKANILKQNIGHYKVGIEDDTNNINSIQGGTGGSGEDGQARAQSFVAAGSLLSKVTTKFFETGTVTDDLTIKIVSTLGGSSLGTITIDGDNISSGSPRTDSFDSPISLTEGNTYYVQVERTGSRDTNNYFSWYLNFGAGEDYPQGENYSRSNNTWSADGANSDNYFSVVFNDTANWSKASLFTIQTKNSSAKANILKTTNKNNSTKASINTQGQQANNSKSNMLVVNNKSSTSTKINIIRIDEQDNNSTKANILYEDTTKNNSTTANIEGEGQAPNSTKANVVVAVSQNSSVKANILKENKTQNNSTLGNIILIRTNNNSAKANVFVESNGIDNQAKSNVIRIDETKNSSVISNINVTNSDNNNARANIFQINTFVENSSKANIFKENETQNNSSKASVVRTESDSTNAKANILVTTSQNNSALGSMYDIYRQSTKVNIKSSTSQNNSVVGNVGIEGSGQPALVKGNIRTRPFEKKYEYRIYDNNVYVTTWAVDVVSEPSFRTIINGGASELIVRLARTFDDFGEDIDVKLNNKVDLWCFDRDAPNGVKLYTGYISGYRPILTGNNEHVEITVLSFLAETSGYMYRVNGGTTTITHNSEDPTNIMTDIIDKYRGQGGTLDYTNTTIETTNTTVSYDFNTVTTKEALDKVIELSPEGWYYYIDANGKVNLHPKPVTATHIFRVGREIQEMETWRLIEDVVNEVFFIGGGSPQMYRYYKNDGSIDAYGRRSVKKIDQRVTNTSTADTISNRIINSRKDPEIRTRLVINDNNGSGTGYDIESIKVGDTFQVGNLKEGVKTVTLWDVAQWDEDVWDQTLAYSAVSAVQILSVDYRPNEVILEASSRIPEINKRIEDINRNAETAVLVDNPASPTDG